MKPKCLFPFIKRSHEERLLELTKRAWPLLGEPLRESITRVLTAPDLESRDAALLEVKRSTAVNDVPVKTLVDYYGCLSWLCLGKTRPQRGRGRVRQLRLSDVYLDFLEDQLNRHQSKTTS